jgi:hypothetical protein
MDGMTTPTYCSSPKAGDTGNNNGSSGNATGGGSPIPRPRYAIPVQFSPIVANNTRNSGSIHRVFKAPSSDDEKMNTSPMQLDDAITVEYAPSSMYAQTLMDMTHTHLPTCCGERVRPKETPLPSRDKRLRDIVKLLQRNSIEDGDCVFVIAQSWWQKLVASLTNPNSEQTDHDDGDVGPIDNWDIIDTKKHQRHNNITVFDSRTPTPTLLGVQTSHVAQAAISVMNTHANTIASNTGGHNDGIIPVVPAHPVDANKQAMLIHLQYQKCRYTLSPSLRHRPDEYVIVHKELWAALRWWYGGGPPIPRIVVVNEPSQTPTQSPMKEGIETPGNTPIHTPPANTPTHSPPSTPTRSRTHTKSLATPSKHKYDRILALVDASNYSVDLFPSEPPSVLEAVNKELLLKNDRSIGVSAQTAQQLSSRLADSEKMDVSGDSSSSPIIKRDSSSRSRSLHKRPLLQLVGNPYNDCGLSRWTNALLECKQAGREDQQHAEESNPEEQTIVMNSLLSCNSCFACRKVGRFQCSSCAAVYYCSRQCQEVGCYVLLVFLLEKSTQLDMCLNYRVGPVEIL